MLSVFLPLTDKLWYLSFSNKSHCTMCHQNHFRPLPHHVTKSYKELSEDIKLYLKQSIENHNNSATIIHMVSTMCGTNITENTVQIARRTYVNQILQEYGLNPGNTNCDKLLYFFRKNTDISFLAVTHSVNSGFVTTRKSKCSKRLQTVNEKYFNVELASTSKDDIKY